VSTQHVGAESGEVDVRHSPLEQRHEALGATLVAFAGWRMPLRYSSELAEHAAVRERAGVFDLSHMGEIAVEGPGAGDLLDAALVGWLSALTPGQARYTMACTESGGVVDDLVVYRRSDEAFLVVANAANAATILAQLAQRAHPGARVTDRTAEVGLVAIQGPRAGRILGALTAAALDTIGNYRALEANVLGRAALVARTGYTGEDGFELFVAAEDAPALFDALLDAGAGEGVLPAGLAARDSLRLEAGMPLYGNELTSETNPYEAGLGRVVRLDKPADFVGRAALARLAAEEPGRRLVGLLAAGARAPRAGYTVRAPGRGGEEAVVGTVTSGAPSPTLRRPIAMAYVARAAAEVGTELTVDVRGRPEPVVVTALPFYRRAQQLAPTRAKEDS
jgi:aminomethyltransferase